MVVIYTWYIVYTAYPFNKSLLIAHPPLQTAAVLAFTMGILTLQPTLSASSKAAGRTRHQLYQLGLGVPLLLAGSLAMIVHKEQKGWSHFQSTHAVCLFDLLFAINETDVCLQKVGLTAIILLVRTFVRNYAHQLLSTSIP